MKNKNAFRILISMVLVSIVSTLLWFAAPTQAFDVAFPSLPGGVTVGTSYNFSVTINIASGELLPLQSADLYIYKSDDRANYEVTCSDLPRDTGTRNYSSVETGNAGAVVVAVSADAGWVVTSGYAYAVWDGTSYPGINGAGYGPGPASITYQIQWTSPASWPVGNYVAELQCTANGVTFTRTSSPFALNAASGGGGGGGGGGGAPAGYTIVNQNMTLSGEFLFPTDAKSSNGRAQILIPQGTFFMVKGFPGSYVSITEMTKEEQPAPPEGSHVIGLMYNFGPEGATFTPAINLTFIYDDAYLPSGTSEEDLALAFWSATDKKWVFLNDCVVDTEKNTIIAKMEHFTPYTILSRAPAVTPTPTTTIPKPTSTTTTPTTTALPAAFTVSNLTITPAEANIGEIVTISVTVANTGDLGASYEVDLEVDGTIAATKSVYLAGKTSKPVTFTITRDQSRTYQVSIKSLSGSFTIRTAPSSAVLTVNSIAISPDVVFPGDTITISANVVNTGDTAGTYQVVLKVNSELISTKEVIIGAKASQVVTFTINKDVTGNYNVDVNGITSSFTVKETPAPSTPINWWLIAAVVAAIAVFAVAIHLTIKREKKHPNAES